MTAEERARLEAQRDVADKWLDDNVRGHKAEDAGAPTKEQKALVRGLSELMQAAGIGRLVQREPEDDVG